MHPESEVHRQARDETGHRHHRPAERGEIDPLQPPGRGDRAIVIDEPGATRDRNYAECSWNDRPFTLIDTGGFEPASEVEILVQMREQTKLAIEEADIILFLMDARDGLTPADQEIARMLRMENKSVFYIVNKIDGPRHEALVAEFYRLGTDTFYPSLRPARPRFRRVDGQCWPPACRLPTRSRTARAGGPYRLHRTAERRRIFPRQPDPRLRTDDRRPRPGPHAGFHRHPDHPQRETVPPDRHHRYPQEEPDQPHDGGSSTVQA